MVLLKPQDPRRKMGDLEALWCGATPSSQLSPSAHSGDQGSSQPSLPSSTLRGRKRAPALWTEPAQQPDWFSHWLGRGSETLLSGSVEGVRGSVWKCVLSDGQDPCPSEAFSRVGETGTSKEQYEIRLSSFSCKCWEGSRLMGWRVPGGGCFRHGGQGRPPKE